MMTCFFSSSPCSATHTAKMLRKNTLYIKGVSFHTVSGLLDIALTWYPPPHLLNIIDTKCLKQNSWLYIRGISAKWLAFLVWISTFWQQSRAVSETRRLPSLPQFCCNEGAVLPKQTGTLERYLNCLLNPGSLSYLHTNGPAAHCTTVPSIRYTTG